MTKVYGAPANHYSVHMELEEIEAKLRVQFNKGSFVVKWKISIKPAIQSTIPIRVVQSTHDSLLALWYIWNLAGRMQRKYVELTKRYVGVLESTYNPGIVFNFVSIDGRTMIT